MISHKIKWTLNYKNQEYDKKHKFKITYLNFLKISFLFFITQKQRKSNQTFLHSDNWFHHVRNNLLSIKHCQRVPSQQFNGDRYTVIGELKMKLFLPKKNYTIESLGKSPENSIKIETEVVQRLARTWGRYGIY